LDQDDFSPLNQRISIFVMADLVSAAAEAAALFEAQINDAKTQFEQSASSTPATSQLALIPLRPPSKKKELEIKRLPIVLGRTNLAQWWYQSCDCQHYYCRLHCRPVAQNIGSLSKVMIQIDSLGKVFVVGKNPHLVTITPERNDSVLQVNDILSIGRRDREPWMRFQVVKSGGTTVPVLSGTRAVKRTSSTASNADVVSGPTQKKRKVALNGANNNHDSEKDKSSSNASNAVSRTAPREGQHPQVLQGEREEAQNQAVQKYASERIDAPAAHKNSSKSSAGIQKPAIQQHDGQLPEWITTTNAKRNRGTRSTSSLSFSPQGTNSKQQQQHQDMAARPPKAAAAEDANYAPNPASFQQKPTSTALANSKKHHHHHHHPELEATRKHRRRGAASSGNAMNGSSKGIRSAEDLFNGSRSHCPQIHLVLQDYDTSATLVRSTQRDGVAFRGDRQPRTDRIFISKFGEGPPSDRIARTISSHSTERGGEVASEQHGLLSKKFAVALLGAAAPAPGPPDYQANGSNSPVVMDGERVVINDVAAAANNAINMTSTNNVKLEQGEKERDLPSRRGRDARRNDSATCRAVLAKYAAENAKRRGQSTQAEGEKTSELED
jgi:hypothetical protein